MIIPVDFIMQNVYENMSNDPRIEHERPINMSSIKVCENDVHNGYKQTCINLSNEHKHA